MVPPRQITRRTLRACLPGGRGGAANWHRDTTARGRVTDGHMISLWYACCCKTCRVVQRRGAGVVDRDGLENRCTLTGTVGSNPTPSANCVAHNILRLRVGCQKTPRITHFWPKSC